MELIPILPGAKPMIEAYGGDGFRIAGTRVSGALLVLPDSYVATSGVNVADIDASALMPLSGAEPPVELLLVGSGAEAATLAPDAIQWLADAGIAVETMATGAACRTFNVLLAEERRVAALLMPVP